MTELEQQLKRELNDSQYNAATHMAGPAVIRAGAGSGKTHTLTSRIMHLVDSGADPKKIVMLTFTNAAANEMKARAMRIDDSCQHVLATTYHKYCCQLLRKYGTAIGIQPNFNVLSSARYTTLIDYVKSSSAYMGTKFNMISGFPSSSVLNKLFSARINTGKNFEELTRDEKYYMHADAIENLFGLVRAYGAKNQQLSFDDLLIYTVDLLADNGICERVAGSFDYLMVDEFQDTNDLQLKILAELGRFNRNIVIVGDISQSIYKFRGAEVRNINRFISLFEPCDIYTLSINYRSTQEILDAANSVMNHNPHSWDYVDMVSNDKHGEKPILVTTPNAFSQADDVINYIRRSGLPLHEIAIIERKSMSSFSLESELNKNHIPYVKRGGLKFTEQQCVVDMIAFLTVVQKPYSIFEWFTVLTLVPGIGGRYASEIAEAISLGKDLEKFKSRVYGPKLIELLAKVESWKPAADNLPVLFDQVRDYYFNLRRETVEHSNKSADNIFDALEKIDNDKKVINVLKDMTAKYHSTLEFLEDIALDTIKEDEDATDKLIITTIHSAKGLEWKMTILIDVVEPSKPEEDPEEALRCWYVAMTRAEESLIISVPRMKLLGRGGGEPVIMNAILNKSLDCFRLQRNM